VGRHNAVDKVIGACLRQGLARPEVLLVSGRVSFEIVQKAAAARVPVVAGVSAPTSLAVRMARALNVTLVGFLRGTSMNVYAGEQRVVGAS
jgi:FdhD protein